MCVIIWRRIIAFGGFMEKKIGNPAPLGLLGFGMTTVLLNLHNAAIMPLSVVILGMGFALGGLCQIIAGIMEFKVGNTFGATAFTAYGAFWWSLVIIWFNPFGEAIKKGDEISMGFYLLLWGIFTLFMYIGTLKHNKITQIVFFTLTLLFFMLAIADFTGISLIHTIAGYVGIFCGLSAIYSCVAQILNEEYKRIVLPVG